MQQTSCWLAHYLCLRYLSLPLTVKLFLELKFLMIIEYTLHEGRYFSLTHCCVPPNLKGCLAQSRTKLTFVEWINERTVLCHQCHGLSLCQFPFYQNLAHLRKEGPQVPTWSQTSHSCPDSPKHQCLPTTNDDVVAPGSLPSQNAEGEEGLPCDVSMFALGNPRGFYPGNTR